MEMLFPDSETFQKKRPVKPTQSQIDGFYKEKANEILKKGWSDSDIEDVIHDLKELHPFRDSGYELAKQLESYGMEASYEFDLQFLEWLDDLHWDYSFLKEENEKAWVKAHGIKAKFPVKSVIIVKKDIRTIRGYNIGDRVFINGIEEETGHYLISKDPNKKGGYKVTYEFV